MSQTVVTGRPAPVRPSEPAAAMAATAATAEVAARAVVGAVGVQAMIEVVRVHPVLSLLFASGFGYLLGNGLRRDPAARPVPAQR